MWLTDYSRTDWIVSISTSGSGLDHITRRAGGGGETNGQNQTPFPIGLFNACEAFCCSNFSSTSASRLAPPWRQSPGKTQWSIAFFHCSVGGEESSLGWKYFWFLFSSLEHILWNKQIPEQLWCMRHLHFRVCLCSVWQPSEMNCFIFLGKVQGHINTNFCRHFVLGAQHGRMAVRNRSSYRLHSPKIKTISVS